MRFWKHIACLVLLLLFLFAAAGCGQAKDSLLQFSPMQDGDLIAVMDTDLGTIRIRLFPEQAPVTVEHFRRHAEAGEYDGVEFHRVINQFMIQSGDIDTAEPNFEDEFSPQLWNFRGALSSANIGIPDTNSTQFFIVQADTDSAMFNQVKANLMKEESYPSEVVAKYLNVGGTPWLDGKHTVFGFVYEGMEVVDAIAAVGTDENDRPTEPVRIRTITIETYKAQ